MNDQLAQQQHDAQLHEVADGHHGSGFRMVNESNVPRLKVGFNDGNDGPWHGYATCTHWFVVADSAGLGSNRRWIFSFWPYVLLAGHVCLLVVDLLLATTVNYVLTTFIIIKLIDHHLWLTTIFKEHIYPTVGYYKDDITNHWLAIIINHPHHDYHNQGFEHTRVPLNTLNLGQASCNFLPFKMGNVAVGINQTTPDAEATSQLQEPSATVMNQRQPSTINGECLAIIANRFAPMCSKAMDSCGYHDTCGLQ